MIKIGEDKTMILRNKRRGLRLIVNDNKEISTCFDCYLYQINSSLCLHNHNERQNPCDKFDHITTYFTRRD